MSQSVSVEITTGRFASLTRDKPAGRWWWSVTTARGHEAGLYRDDSETTVVFERVKHAFMTADNTILTIAQYADDGSHHYINYPRERVCWWKLERVR